MSGIFHPYYNVALAPAVAAVVAHRRHAPVARPATGSRRALVMAAGVGVTGWWSTRLLDRTPSWHPELRQLILLATVVAVPALLVGPLLAGRRAVTAVAGIAAAIALVAGPGAYALATAGTAHAGSIPTSGPAAGDGRGSGRVVSGAEARRANAELTALLAQDAGLHRWAAATVGSQTAAALQLASGQSVMAIGGFNGGDPAPTLAQFQQLVAQGRDPLVRGRRRWRLRRRCAAGRLRRAGTRGVVRRPGAAGGLRRRAARAAASAVAGAGPAAPAAAARSRRGWRQHFAGHDRRRRHRLRPDGDGERVDRQPRAAVSFRCQAPATDRGARHRSRPRPPPIGTMPA